MSEMIERVARVIATAQAYDLPPSQRDGLEPEAWAETWWVEYVDVARAAIKAMRAPTKPMLKAACAAMSPGERPTQKRVSVKAKHGIRYRAMIDAALQATPQAVEADPG